MATPTRSTALDQLLERHRIEAARLREQWGDPDELLGRVVRDMFTAEELEAAFQALTRPGSLFGDDDLDDVDPDDR